MQGDTITAIPAAGSPRPYVFVLGASPGSFRGDLTFIDDAGAASAGGLFVLNAPNADVDARIQFGFPDPNPPSGPVCAGVWNDGTGGSALIAGLGVTDWRSLDLRVSGPEQCAGTQYGIHPNALPGIQSNSLTGRLTLRDRILEIEAGRVVERSIHPGVLGQLACEKLDARSNAQDRLLSIFAGAGRVSVASCYVSTIAGGVPTLQLKDGAGNPTGPAPPCSSSPGWHTIASGSSFDAGEVIRFSSSGVNPSHPASIDQAVCVRIRELD